MTTRLSLSWLHLFLILSLVAAWLGFWNIVREQVEREGRPWEPREDEVLLKHGVPRLQADLARVQGELVAVRGKIHENRVEKAGTEAALEATLAAFPVLKSLGVGPSGSGPDWLAVRAEVLQAYAQARLDLDSTARLARALEAELDALIARRADLSAEDRPSGQTKSGAARGELIRKDRLAALGQQIEATQKTLSETRVELARRRTRVEATAASDRRLAALPAGAEGLLSLSPDAFATLVAAPSRRRTSEALDTALRNAANGLASEAERLSSTLIRRQREAAQELEALRHDRETGRRLGILRRALWPALGLFAAFVALHLALSRQAIGGPNRLLLYGTALGALVVLYASQAFDLAGGALAAVVLLLAIGGLVALRGGSGGERS